MVVQEERAGGYAAGLAAAGLPLDPELVVESPPSREGGEAALGRALALADPPTAALCFNDVVAFGVLHGLGRRGLEVGRDFALVGFDDVRDARAAVPPLTSVAVDPPGLGERAAQILLEIWCGTRRRARSSITARRGSWSGRPAAPSGRREWHDGADRLGPDRRQHHRAPARASAPSGRPAARSWR